MKTKQDQGEEQLDTDERAHADRRAQQLMVVEVQVDQ